MPERGCLVCGAPGCALELLHSAGPTSQQGEEGRGRERREEGGKDREKDREEGRERRVRERGRRKVREEGRREGGKLKYEVDW